MTITKRLIAECGRRGITLEPNGNLLLVTPEESVPPELVEKLRVHKREILAVLGAQQKISAKHLAKQVLLGEFEGFDIRTRLNIAKILRDHLEEPLVRGALAHLYKDKLNKKEQR